MNQYNIRYSKEVKQDLIDIKKYIKYNLQEPNIVNKLITKIKSKIGNLIDDAMIYNIIDDDFIKKMEIRKLLVDNYIVFFRIRKYNIEIVRILYSRRNWITLL